MQVLTVLHSVQFIKQQRTKGHLQVASIDEYNSYSAQSTGDVYNMDKIMHTLDHTMHSRCLVI